MAFPKIDGDFVDRSLAVSLKADCEKKFPPAAGVPPNKLFDLLVSVLDGVPNELSFKMLYFKLLVVNAGIVKGNGLSSA